MKMLEKMARAFMVAVAAQEWPPYVSNGPDDEANDLEPRIDGTVELIPAIRAALEAVREMDDVLRDTLMVAISHPASLDDWTAMIDAILAEGSEG